MAQRAVESGADRRSSRDGPRCSRPAALVGGLLRERAGGASRARPQRWTFQQDRDVEVRRGVRAGALRRFVPVTRRSRTIWKSASRKTRQSDSVPAGDSRTARVEPPRAGARRSSCCKSAAPYELGTPPCSALRVLRHPLSGLCARPGLSGRTPGRRSGRRIPEDSRSPHDRGQRSDRRAGASATGPGVRVVG